MTQSLEANLKVELDISNYATNSDSKNAARVDTLNFTKNTNLANLKYDIRKLDIDKLKNVQVIEAILKVKEMN